MLEGRFEREFDGEDLEARYTSHFDNLSNRSGERFRMLSARYYPATQSRCVGETQSGVASQKNASAKVTDAPSLDVPEAAVAEQGFQLTLLERFLARQGMEKLVLDMRVGQAMHFIFIRQAYLRNEKALAREGLFERREQVQQLLPAFEEITVKEIDGGDELVGREVVP
jgi:hypothetical protein